MEKEDKIAFGVLAAVIGAVVFGLLWLVKFVGSAVFGFFATSEGVGMGIKDAYPYGIGISILLIIIFALVAGDGALGELPLMVISFFLFAAFFTFSIAWLY